MELNIHGVTTGETASAAAPSKSIPTLPLGVAIDAKGRRIKVKQLDPLRVFQLAIAMGQSADSVFARNYASLAASVQEIDGDICSFPANNVQIQAMLQRLGIEGLDAVLTAISDIDAATKTTTSNESAEKNS